MNNLSAFFKLIRVNNLLIIFFTQIIVKFCLIFFYLEDSALSHINFIIYLIALITIVAGGYIINDIYDIEIDKINKPEKRVIGKEICKKNAYNLYYLLNLTGLAAGFYVAYQIDRSWYGFIFIFFIFSLWIYSKEYKMSFLLGNIYVAFLIALSIFTLAIYDLLPLGINDTNGSKIIFYIILAYSAFSFITTLIREIIKDLEDIEGDKKIGANTIAIKLNLSKTKMFVSLLILTTIIGIGYFQYFQYSVFFSTFSIKLDYWGVNLPSILYTLVLQIILLILIIKIQLATKKESFTFLSKLCKICMIVGILSIPLFSYLHLN